MFLTLFLYSQVGRISANVTRHFEALLLFIANIISKAYFTVPPNFYLKYLILCIDECLSIASHLRVLQAHVLPDCNGDNQYAVENPAHLANNAPSHDVAIFPVVFNFYGFYFQL